MILADNASALAVKLEETIIAMLNGSKAVNMGEFGSALNTLRRTLESLGLRRVPKDIASVETYLEQHAGKVNSDAS
jgi:hypothetical protein